MDNKLATIFLQAGLRLTIPRTTVFDFLKSSDRPVSMSEIIQSCPEIDKVSVYRTLDVFNRLKITKSVPHGWKYLYELAPPFKPHHHHLICNQCGKVIDIRPDKLESIVQDLADNYDFTPTDHHFEIIGLCSECQKQNK